MSLGKSPRDSQETSPPATVNRMARVERQSVKANIRTIATPFRRVRETYRERTARLIRIRPRPIRNDRGSCQQRGLPSNAPSLSWYRAGVFHLQAPAEVPAALSSASQDATRRSKAAIWSSPQGDRRGLYERAPRRFRQG